MTSEICELPSAPGRTGEPSPAARQWVAPLSFDTFNDPNVQPAAIDEVVTVSFPPEACLVIGSGPAPEVDIVAEG